MTRRRRSAREEHDNHERWLVSYADFITLLFAFFVVMYSVSQVHEGKYKMLSDSVEAAFRQEPRSVTPIQIGDPKSAAGDKVTAVLKPDGEAAFHSMAQVLRKQLQPLVDRGLLTLRDGKDWLEIAINNRILFPSGSTRLLPDATALLSLLAEVLAKFPVPIQVEGHTDNVPIHTPSFPSNWELSAARAATVARLLAQHGIEPDRLAATGFAETRPVASNERAEGRAENRRVILRIFKTGRSSNGENRFPAPVVSGAAEAEGMVK